MTLTETDRLEIRAFEESDFESLVALMTDADSMRYTGFKTPQTTERIRELLAKWRKEGLQRLGVWAVDQKDPREFVGWVMLKPTTSETPELGYMILKSQWSKGFASEIASIMLNYASQKLKIPRVVAVTSPENQASVRILEKIGMNKSIQQGREDGGICYEIEFRLRP